MLFLIMFQINCARQFGTWMCLCNDDKDVKELSGMLSAGIQGLVTIFKEKDNKVMDMLSAVIASVSAAICCYLNRGLRL